MAGEQAIDQVIGAQKVRLVAQIVQDVHRGRMRVRRITQGGPEKTALWPMVGEGVKRLFVPAKERGFQGGGEAEVIFGQGQKAENRDDVLDGKLGADLEPV